MNQLERLCNLRGDLLNFEVSQWVEAVCKFLVSEDALNRQNRHARASLVPNLNQPCDKAER
jgi:hypothetical protein